MPLRRFVLLILLAAAAPAVEHPLGVKALVPHRDAAMAYAPRAGATLPSSVDLSSDLAPVGDQGAFGSCVGWAVAYTLKTQQEQRERRWGTTTTTHQFSPLWIYNQINGGVDEGSLVDDALDLLQARGCDTLADFHPTTVAAKPDARSMAAALPYRVASWNTIDPGPTSVKTILAQGRPIVAVIAVHPDFDALSPANPVYDSVAGANRGLHAICIVGYDDARGAVKIVNQWGTEWGLGGYGWIAYGLIAPGSKAVLELYDVQDAVPAEVSITAGDASASEAPGQPGAFTIARTGDTSAALTVALAISGTATSGRDYQAIPLAVTIPSGKAATTIAVTPIDDAVAEPRETVILRLARGDYAIGSPASATVAIDDDETPRVTIAATDASADEAGDPAVFTVRRVGSLASALIVPLRWSGTAVAGRDYRAPPASVRLRAGAASAAITITPIVDAGVQPDRSLIATVSAGTGFAVGAPASATATIAEAAPAAPSAAQ